MSSRDAPTMPSEAPPRPTRRDAVRNRQRVLDAAAEVFEAEGLDVAMTAIARTAGVGTGTVYRHFPTKDDLIDALVGDLLRDLLDDASAAIDEPGGYGLQTFLRALGDRQSSRQGCIPRLWSTTRHEDLMSGIRAATAELVADARRHGRVRDDVTAADMFVVMWSLRGVIETTRGVAPDAWRRHLDVLLAGFAPSPEPLPNPPIAEGVVERLVATVTAERRA